MMGEFQDWEEQERILGILEEFPEAEVDLSYSKHEGLDEVLAHIELGTSNPLTIQRVKKRAEKLEQEIFDIFIREAKGVIADGLSEETLPADRIRAALEVVEAYQGTEALRYVLRRLRRTENVEEYRTRAKGFVNAAETIQKAGPENIQKELDAMMIYCSSMKNAKKANEYLKSVMQDSNLAHLATKTKKKRKKIFDIPEQLKDLIYESERRDKMLEMLVNVPVSRLLQPESFAYYFENPRSQAYLNQWIKNPIEERVAFYDEVRQRIGFEKAKTIGKVILEAAYQESPSQKRDALLDALQELGKNVKGRTKLIQDLAWELQNRPGGVLESIKICSETLARCERVKRLRNEHKQLARVLTSDNYFAILDERLIGALSALSEHDEIHKMLASLGKDLKKVNKAYSASNVPAAYFIGACAREIAPVTLEHEDRMKLQPYRGLECAKALAALGREGDTSLITELGKYIPLFGRLSGLENPVEFLRGLSHWQKDRLNQFRDDLVVKVAESVKPEQYENAYVSISMNDGIKCLIGEDVDWKLISDNLSEFESLKLGRKPELAYKQLAKIIMQGENVQLRAAALRVLSNFADNSFQQGSAKDYNNIRRAMDNADDLTLRVMGGMPSNFSIRSIKVNDAMRYFEFLSEVAKEKGIDDVELFAERAKSYYESFVLGDGKIQRVADYSRNVDAHQQALQEKMHSRYSLAYDDPLMGEVLEIPEIDKKKDNLIQILNHWTRTRINVGTLIRLANNYDAEIISSVAEMYTTNAAVSLECAILLATNLSAEAKMQNMSAEEKVTYSKIAVNIKDMQRLFNLGDAETATLINAYDLISARLQEMPEAEGKFFKSLDQAIERGQVQKWASALIRGLTQDTYGGERYRELAPA